MTPEIQEQLPQKKTAEETGYSFEAIKICVNGITDRTIQRKLREKRRNKTFCKVVNGKEGEGNFICESDDFVFILHFDYNSRDFSGSEWFPEPDQRSLSKYEGDILRQLRDCDRVDTNHYKDFLALAKKELKIVGDVVRQSLGWVTLTLNNCSCAMVMLKTE